MSGATAPTTNPASLSATQISLPDLVKMFQQAAQRGLCPDEAILSRFTRLQNYGWARALRQMSRDAVTSDPLPSELAVIKALDVLDREVPYLISLNRQLLADGLSKGTHGSIEDKITSYERLLDAAPDVRAAVGPFRRATRDAVWHVIATTVARDARAAWELAGRERFGTNPTSPLVVFTQAFLQCAGEHQQADAIAAVFRRTTLL